MISIHWTLFLHSKKPSFSESLYSNIWSLTWLPIKTIELIQSLYALHQTFAFTTKQIINFTTFQTLPCLVRMCSKERLLEERVEGAETLAYLIEPDVELQRIASITDHLIAMLADYFKYPSSVSAITDIKRVCSVFLFSSSSKGFLRSFSYCSQLWTNW